MLEDGHNNRGDAERIYEWADGRIGQHKALSGLSFAGKEGSLPLAAADLFAYSSWGVEVGQKPIGVPKKPGKSDTSYRGNLHRVALDRLTLEGLHRQAIMFAQERRAV